MGLSLPSVSGGPRRSYPQMIRHSYLKFYQKDVCNGGPLYPGPNETADRKDPPMTSRLLEMVEQSTRFS